MQNNLRYFQTVHIIIYNDRYNREKSMMPLDSAFLSTPGHNFSLLNNMSGFQGRGRAEKITYIASFCVVSENLNSYCR
jgi:hypothetical protein